MAAVLASSASCGQSRRGIRSRTASRCSQDSSQKAAMYTRGALVDMPQPLWDWWKARAEVNSGLTERSLFRRVYPYSECNREIQGSCPGTTYDGACKDMHPLQAPWTATAILASRSARTSWFAGRAIRASARYEGARTGQVDHIPQDQAHWVGRPYRALSTQRRADVRRLRCRRPRAHRQSA